MNRFRLLLAVLVLATLFNGCSRKNNNNSASQQQVKSAQREEASDRLLLEQIPPPSKTRYMAIHTKDSWDNPFLVVSSETVSLRVMNPAAPRSSILPSGSMMQPESARKNLLELRISNLAEALASIPQEDWPYGRVVAVQEDPAEVRADRVQVRRSIEATMQLLNNLGIVAYEWPAGR
jgi:hypothetical protein